MSDKKSLVNVMVNFQLINGVPTWTYTPPSPIKVAKGTTDVSFTLDDTTRKTYRFVGVTRGYAYSQVSSMTVGNEVISISDKDTVYGEGIALFLTVASGDASTFTSYTSPDPQIINDE